MTTLSILSKQIRLHDGLYSINDLHQVSGGLDKNRPVKFLRLEQTKDLINEISTCPDMDNPVETKRGIGTWVCKELVYAYAMWISPKFHLQVIRAFDAQQQQAITKAPAPLDYQRIMLTIENGQTTHTQALALEDMVTSFDKIPGILRESMKIQPYQLAQIAKAANERLSRMIHKR
ncbi:KilA-N domain-containing protein [Pseudoalteromonas sp. SR41-8]|uniref:KilA-N domain-containing protein n=1 Tax=Pseudoalteromonas sp. SR41-8 TaxID=2760946 RepID=UPI0016024FF9|nr:KilA-N domain-containing protein [Pseudoalteromonas sp. SR41-8]MBB1308573.1 KilA-N domain-containing protein [Pseudoalteromonas sp. SR41-8]